MASLLELVEKVNRNDPIDADALDIYQESSNAAERFLSNHAQATLDLRKAQQHMLQSLEAIDYADQKVLTQFISVSSFLGLSNLRTHPIVRFAAAAIARKEYSLALEALQNALAADLASGATYLAERENLRLVAEQYERAAQAVAFRSESSRNPVNPSNVRIGYVVSSVADDDASTATLLAFARHLDAGRFKLNVYSTEAGVRRDKSSFPQNNYVPASAKRGQQTLDTLGQKRVVASFAPTDGDLVAAAKELAGQITRDQCDVVLFDVSPTDPIAAIVAAWDVAPVKINLARKFPLGIEDVAAIVYFDASRYESDREYHATRGTQVRSILEGVETEEITGTAPARSSYGIPDSAVVLATASNDLDRAINEPFVEAIIQILKQNPQAIHLLVGEGELGWQKRKFESAGVSKRVGYAARRKDFASFVRIADVYLADFSASPNGVLHAMNAEKSVVAAGSTDAANFAGPEATVAARDTAAYVERATRLIKDPAYRTQLAGTLRNRAKESFAVSQTVKQIEHLIDQSVGRLNTTTQSVASIAA